MPPSTKIAWHTHGVVHCTSSFILSTLCPNKTQGQKKPLQPAHKAMIPSVPAHVCRSTLRSRGDVQLSQLAELQPQDQLPCPLTPKILWVCGSVFSTNQMSQIKMLQTNFEVSCKLLFHSKPAWIQKFLLKKRISDREGRQISQKTLKSNPSCSADRSIKFAI